MYSVHKIIQFHLFVHMARMGITSMRFKICTGVSLHLLLGETSFYQQCLVVGSNAASLDPKT